MKVIVPCYRYGHFLEGCLESVLWQPDVDVRVLVVDDCSPDASAEIARALADRDRRVEVHVNEHNLGIVGTSNVGLDWAADADYVVVLSADDRLTPSSLRRAVETMESNPAVGLVYGRVAPFESDSDPVGPEGRWRGTKVWPGGRWLERRCRSGKNCTASPEVVVRGPVQRAAGRYASGFPHTTDFEMWMRIAAIADVAYLKGVAQARYRVHPESMFRTMLNGEGGSLIALEERRAAFEHVFAGLAGELPGASSMRAEARRSLAREALWQANRMHDRGEEPALAEPLVEFAIETAPEAQRLRQWWELQLRLRVGSPHAFWLPPLLLGGAAHRTRVGIDRAYARWWGV